MRLLTRFLTGELRTPRERAWDRWTAGLLTLPCEECPSGPGTWCDDLHPPEAEMVRVAGDPARFVHSTRIVAAVRGGHVSRSVTIAQFAGGPVAAGLTDLPATTHRVRK
jgi:hypothetical protein